MDPNFEVDRIQAIAVTLFTSALIERCQEMLVRLTTAQSFAAEFADFQSQAILHVKNAVPAGLTEADEADAMRLACEHIAEVCSEWLRGQSRPPGAPNVH